MSSSDPSVISRKWRLGISALICFHLAAVFLHPLAFQTQGEQGRSPAVATMLGPVLGYGQFTYVDRGYAFFAPDPGPSHLIQAEMTAADGSKVEKTYPDLQQHWPRLLYHRHFMLAEYITGIYEPPGPPAELAEIDAELAQQWTRLRSRYEHVWVSFADHLRSQHEGQTVGLRRVEHLIPDLQLYREEPIDLTDDQLYQVLLDLPIEFDLPAVDEETLSTPSETVPAPPGDRER